MLFGTSCKERPCPEYEVKVDTSYIPLMDKEPLESYHGFDTLTFLTEKGDTITFLGQGPNTGFKQKDNYAEDYCSTKSTTFKQFTGYTFYPISQYASDIQYYIARALSHKNGIDFNVLINKLTFSTSPSLPKLGSPSYIHNLNINGNVYDNVMKIFKNGNINEKSFIYYSKVNGIILIQFSDGSSLTKIK
jgi:hypothetical protein